MDLSFLGLRSAILSEDNCSTALLQSNKTEYDNTVAKLAILNNYIVLNKCEKDGQINTLGKNDFEIAACQRKLNLRKNKTDFTTQYLACQESTKAASQVVSVSASNNSDANSTNMTE